jgi:murein DD-endopeptidase MepM/ murein hydrolase activator NlpD
MKFLKNIRAWQRNFFRKRRFNMLNATDNSEEWHMHLSPASIFAAFVSFALLLFILILTLVAYSPVLEFLPGYRTEADRSRESLVQNIIRLDSMERMMNDMLTYNQNIALIMEGKTPVARVLANSDSTRATKVLVMPSPEDSVLRAQMEGDGEYAVTGRSGGSRRSVREAIELATPVEGIITDQFDIRNGNFGIRIAAAASDRIAAVDNGTVVLSLWTPETGYMVELQHAGNLLSVYKGLSQSLVTKGQTIRAGELIGYNAEAEQGEMRLFEFELWNNGKPVDPEGYIVFQ